MSQEKTFAVLEPLVMAISVRALFDMEKENAVFEEYGLESYREYQSVNKNQILSRGSAFHLVSGLLQFNEMVKEAEKIYKEHGLDAFIAHERLKASCSHSSATISIT